ncbi:hypothetical protein QQF64_027724 [Cirrhinus molitorella]|uniref:Uncharacterized protein n=1 Tax=Cirrhinus molitorella TaxID=172907 RepID=A0ABR3ND67_9TELE
MEFPIAYSTLASLTLHQGCACLSKADNVAALGLAVHMLNFHLSLSVEILGCISKHSIAVTLRCYQQHEAPHKTSYPKERRRCDREGLVNPNGLLLSDYSVRDRTATT